MLQCQKAIFILFTSWNSSQCFINNYNVYNKIVNNVAYHVLIIHYYNVKFFFVNAIMLQFGIGIVVLNVHCPCTFFMVMMVFVNIKCCYNIAVGLVLKWCFKCLIECLASLGFNSIAGHPCLFFRKTVINGKPDIKLLVVFVDD